MQRSCDRCKGDGTWEGRGWEGSRLSSQRSYDRWGKGQGQGELGRGRRGRGGGGGGGGWGGGEEREGGGGLGKGKGGEEEREGARQARHFGPVGPFTLGQSGPSFWAHPASHPWARPARHLCPSDPLSIKPVGWPRALKKKLNSGPARPVDCQRAYRPGPNRAVGLT